jgi:CubicO group peptidase (beta-lactamase class C family)
MFALFAAALAACSPAAPSRPPDATRSTSSPASVALEPAAGFPRQPQGVPFPTESWPEGQWPAGVDRPAIEDAVDLAFAGGGAQRVRAVVVIHGGKLVYERYSPHRNDRPDSVMPAHSMAKSFTAAMVGILVEQGRLAVDAPAAVPAWQAAGDPRGAITLDDLLRMSSGLEWDDAPYPHEGDFTRMLASADAAAYSARKKLIHEPGTRFLYSNGSTTLINGILADEVGPERTFREFMNAELLTKIGIGRMDMEFDRAGTWYGAFSADMTARDYAKFGLLYLRDGVWNGERILPEGWVDYSRQPSRANPEYGAGWWLDLERPGVFYAVGKAGQVITVAPEHDLTFVHLATDGAVALPVSEAILNAFDARD